MKGGLRLCIPVELFEQQGQVVLDPGTLGQAGRGIAQVNDGIFIGLFFSQQQA